MAIVQDWKIRSRSHRCCYSDEPFEDGDEFYTCIFADPESDGYIRRDYAAKNWPLILKNLDPPPFSFWKSAYEAPVPEVEEEPLEQESAETMLRRMIDEDNPTTENARYILAVMLERKKTLVPVDDKETDSGKLIFYEHKGNGDVFIVRDPQLRLDDLGKVQEEVSALLGGGKKEETGEAEADGEASPENPDSNSETDTVESGEDAPSSPEPMASDSPSPSSASRWLGAAKQELDELVVQLRLGKAEATDYVESHKSDLDRRLGEIQDSLGDSETYAALRGRLDELRVQLALGKMESRDQLEVQRARIGSAIHAAREEWQTLEEGLRDELGQRSESLETKLNALGLDLGIAAVVAEDDLKVRKEELALQAERLGEKVKSASSEASEKTEEIVTEAREAWTDLKDNLRRLFS